MKISDIVAQRLREECIRRQAEMDDPTLNTITFIVRLDAKTRQPRALLFRTECERRLLPD